MNIEKIYIDGFRSIKELTMKVNGNLQIIIGKNDTGKSNILRSLDLFFNNSIDKEQLIWDRDFNTTYLRAKGKNAPNCITLYLKYKLPKAYSESKLYRALIDSLGDSFYIGKRIYQNRSEIYYSKNEDDIFNAPLMESSDIYQNVIRFMGYIHYFYVPINKDESWLKESYIFEDIKNRFMDAWGKGGTSRKKISELRSQIEKLLKGIQDAVDDGMNEVTKGFVELFPDYKKVTFKTPKSANDLFRLLDIEVLSEGNISTTLGARGSGVQSASIPLLLYYVDTGKIVSARTSLYLPIWGIEEPESFQHDSLACKISEFFTEKICQRIPVFITTHSSYYLNPKYSESIHLCKTEKSSTEISDLSSDWNKYFEIISNEVGYNNLSKEILLLVKKNHDKKFIVFEGKTDMNVFDKVKTISTEISAMFNNYVPIDGEGGNLPGKVKLLEKAGNEIVVILDGDDQGKKYYAELIKLKSNNIKLTHYSFGNTKDNVVLETMIEDSVKLSFKEQMPDNAREFWYKQKTRIEEEVYIGVEKPPTGWDKDGLKNKLVTYLIDNYSEPEHYSRFIAFYQGLTGL